MKKIVMICMLLAITSGCASKGRVLGDRFTFHINGIDVERVSSSIKEEPVETIAGALTAMVVHEVGHIVAMEVAGADYKFETPLTFRYKGSELDDGTKGWIARSGFVAQAVGGWALTHIPATRESAFTFGYTGMAAAQTILYPLPPGEEENDLTELDKYGYNMWAEWGGYSLLSLYNLHNSMKKSKETLAKEEYAREQEE